MKILVVEDDPASLELVYTLLKLDGYEVLTAVDGQEGLDYYNKYKPDLIVSDIEMPYMTGLTLLSKLREQKSDVFFIITTAFGSENYAMEALKKGANNYLKKPIATKMLQSIVAKYANIIKNRKLAQKAAGKIISKKIQIEFATNYKHIPLIVSQLISEITVPIDDTDKTNIEIGLGELITNSIEHGNLNISYKEKVEAANSNTLNNLYKQRMQLPEYSKKRVIVDYKQTSEAIEWIITDEGNGFNWQATPDPTQGTNLLELSGRGIFLTSFSFDEMEYSGKGNVVRIKKILQHDEQ